MRLSERTTVQDIATNENSQYRPVDRWAQLQVLGCSLSELFVIIIVESSHRSATSAGRQGSSPVCKMAKVQEKSRISDQMPGLGASGRIEGGGAVL